MCPCLEACKGAENAPFTYTTLLTVIGWTKAPFPWDGRDRQALADGQARASVYYQNFKMLWSVMVCYSLLGCLPVVSQTARVDCVDRLRKPTDPGAVPEDNQ